MPEFVNTTDLIKKIRESTGYEKKGLIAAPPFLRSDNAGKFKVAFLLLEKNMTREGRSKVFPKELIFTDVSTGEILSKEDAVRFFEAGGIDVRDGFLPARKVPDKETADRYREEYITLFDCLRLSAFQKGEVKPDEYLSYLDCVLYTYSDEFAGMLLFISRTFSFPDDVKVRCRCGAKYNVPIYGYAAGQIAVSTCTRCGEKNQTLVRKEGAVKTYTKEYLSLYRALTEEDEEDAENEPDESEEREEMVPDLPEPDKRRNPPVFELTEDEIVNEPEFDEEFEKQAFGHVLTEDKQEETKPSDDGIIGFKLHKPTYLYITRRIKEMLDMEYNILFEKEIKGEE